MPTKNKINIKLICFNGWKHSSGQEDLYYEHFQPQKAVVGSLCSKLGNKYEEF